MNKHVWKLCCLKIENDRLWRHIRSRPGFEKWVQSNNSCSWPCIVMEFTISKLNNIRQLHGHEEQVLQNRVRQFFTVEYFDYLYNTMTDLWKQIFQPNYCCMHIIKNFDDLQFLYSRQKELNVKFLYLFNNV